jgi:catechol 2,3-dioxygenase-like lactoylglutathione lyase family enzyme
MKVESVLYMLWVEDMERAVEFYEDVMGLNVK